MFDMDVDICDPEALRPIGEWLDYCVTSYILISTTLYV